MENLTGTTTAEVTVEVLNMETQSFTVSNISYSGLPEGYSAEVITQSLPVTIRGSAEDLASIRPKTSVPWPTCPRSRRRAT